MNLCRRKNKSTDSFEEWMEEVKDIQEVRKHGDQAFLEQDFETAIHCYSQFIDSRRTVYPSVYARRSLCYLFCNQPDRALYDGMIAQEVFPDWPTAFYLQSVALYIQIKYDHLILLIL
ncbi:unnamed protein product [Brassica rapa]|uniref:Serine/threonine-protein kinase BSK n=3 Tax=Brassica TaxID=3705 RepID=A0A078JN92_BRANA|nr:unnamed protein product [Brassica napus]CAG7904723.1 unnamed protein product [Brassica rapa]CDY66812.1 BnaCnng52430D [Brassica napus]VDD02211.1 unnamed protein product [Brassica rapa]